MKSYNTYLRSTKTGKTFHFPVNPLIIQGDDGKTIMTYDIMGKGEVDFINPKAKPIDTISLNILLPEEYQPFCSYKDIPGRIEAHKILSDLMNEEEPLRLIITGYGFNRLVWLERITHNEAASNQDLRTLELPFRIINEHGAADTVVKKKSKDEQLELKDNRKKPAKEKIYTVKKGDTLWNIAKSVYGKGSEYKKIYEANKKTIGNNPNLIKTGQKFIIP